MAQALAGAGGPPLDVSIAAGDMALTGAEAADVVTASYALTELTKMQAAEALARLWPLARRLLVIVEPGTADGFARILGYRDALLAQGASIAAPCSHDARCPLAGQPRWCHFGVRLPRSRDHLAGKGASVPFEDEKFIYLAAVRDRSAVMRGQRVLATPRVTKAGVALMLCAPEEVEERIVPSRQKQAFRTAKRLDWGDAIAD
jgi:ribosomal protein RSM22 (predicted rRNA methylase)